MRRLRPVSLLLVASLVTACGDASSSKSSTAVNRPKLDAQDARIIGMHSQALQLRSEGKFAESLALLDQALALDPNDIRVRFNRATVLAQLERRQEALTAFDELLRITPNDPQIFQNRAAILNDMGRSEEAMIEVDRSIALEDAPERRALRGAVLLKMGKPQEALAELDVVDAAVARAGQGAERLQIAIESKLYRASAYEALGRPADAAQIYDSIRAAFPGDARVEALLRERGAL